MTVSSPLSNKPAFITEWRCNCKDIPTGIVIRKIVISGLLSGYAGSGLQSQLIPVFANTSVVTSAELPAWTALESNDINNKAKSIFFILCSSTAYT